VRRRFLLAAGLPAGVLVLALGAFVAEGGSSAVPTQRLSEAPFVVKVTAEGVLKAAESTPVSTPISAGSAMTLAWIVEDGSRVRAGEVVARFDPSDFQKMLLDGRGDEATAKEKMEKAGASRAATQKDMALDEQTAKAELAHAREFQSTDREIFSRFDIAKSQIDTELAQAKESYAAAMTRAKGALSQTDVELYRIDAAKAAKDAERAEKALAAVEVKAPHDGVMVLARNWQGYLPRPGQTFWPGQKLGEIPDTKNLQAEVYVLEADAGGLTAGQRAEVEPYGTRGEVLVGKVSRVDSLAQPRFPEVPVQYFGATLTFSGPVPSDLVPGQRVRAEILVQDLPKALVVPRQAVYERDGKPVVYLQRWLGSFDSVPVVLGPGALGRVVVRQGLKAGQVIALVEPGRSRERASSPKGAGPPLGGAP
jgi:multidrug efflux pump subunit AcrA (membrane-fusion protein)